MNRLTEKNYIFQKTRENGKTQQQKWFEDLYNKLSQLEDIEEELGIDLITLFKALKNGVYYKGEYYPRCSINSMNWGILFIHYDYEEDYVHIVNIEDYGKTWSLNKEDLQ